MQQGSVSCRMLSTLAPPGGGDGDNSRLYSRKKYQPVEVCLLGVNEAIGIRADTRTVFHG